MRNISEHSQMSGELGRIGAMEIRIIREDGITKTKEKEIKIIRKRKLMAKRMMIGYPDPHCTYQTKTQQTQ